MILDKNDFESIICELCGQDQSELLFETPDRLHNLPGKFNIVQCKNCGLIYINPRPVDIRAYYPPDSYAAHGGKRSKSHFSVAPLRSVGLRRRRRAVLARKRSGRLLDVGCGTGDFLNAMKQKSGWDTVGLEPSSAAATQARQIYGLDIQVGQLDEVEIPEASFDVITLWHVLEHTPHPRQALIELGRILKPDGVLVLACPIVDSWEANFFGACWAGYDAPRHFYTFSRQTLSRLLGECGFDCEELTGVVLGFNSLRISVAFWLNERIPPLTHVRLWRGMAINLIAGLLYLVWRWKGSSRSPGVATFCATLKD
jgi:SAM-dependent methyltransferase